MMHPIMDILFNRPDGIHTGIYSCCSAHPFVLTAAVHQALDYGAHLLVESTANQVDQFGGYTGMTPELFRDYVMSIAYDAGLPDSQLTLGGDHLGPLTWSDLPSVRAMENACALVDAYVSAGFSKIHLDTSMFLADDERGERLPDAVISERSAQLCAVSEAAYERLRRRIPNAPAPVYVIGSEVPVPGGAQHSLSHLSVTDPQDFRNMIDTFEKAFAEAGLQNAWKRVIGVVVQPGIEFGDSAVFAYDRDAAKPLTDALKEYPQFVLEGHSTDYQTPELLCAMVEDGIRILKVGPALTFALREALFSLEMIERETVNTASLSHFRDTLDEAMLRAPMQWRKHYHGDDAALRLARSFSFSDRARYYLNTDTVAASMKLLLSNLGAQPVPLMLLSQFMPFQYEKVRAGRLANEPAALIEDHISRCINHYLHATRQ